MQEAVERVDPDKLASAADFALERLAKSQGKVGANFGFVGSRTTTMLANLAAARPGGVLYDPACGIGPALLESVTLGARPERVIGHDINERALHIAEQRAELHGIDIELTKTDILSADVDPTLRADVVILEPAFGLRLDASARLTDARFQFGTPPRSSADTAWLQHVVAHLAETGRGYVLSPSGTLLRGGEERSIRTELVRRGCVEAVVGLSGKLLPHTSIPLALWVLRRPVSAPATEQVLFIDASEAVAPENRVATWLNDPATRQDVPHVEVPVADVARGGVGVHAAAVGRPDRARAWRGV
ncbi:N-6 DNA methylase [Actinopolymorpha pittospori]|uniref:Type I restriction-modification system DNA methylase subunit n=1 Tax=Actinopolymorpha pittospori TaxID=648752 RepID=A0A927MX33_9ACTN|nr:type I restriction-modification system DNA methylase subunit [Actinopolymorpha pittospori]